MIEPYVGGNIPPSSVPHTQSITPSSLPPSSPGLLLPVVVRADPQEEGASPAFGGGGAIGLHVRREGGREGRRVEGVCPCQLCARLLIVEAHPSRPSLPPFLAQERWLVHA